MFHLDSSARGLDEDELADHLYSAEVRWRFDRRLYALAQGGTRLYPRADGTLRPVAVASVGLGVDDAR